MIKKLLLTIVFIFSFSNVFSQNTTKEINISGKVIDKATKQPLEYATIVIKNTETQKISGGITDEKGNFSIKIPTGSYEISVEFISFKSKKYPKQTITKDLNLGTIEISESSKSLDEVVIIAEKTTVDIRLDKKIFNIGKDLSIRGGNASDVLGNVPSVQVDVEGNVSLRGNDNVTILIDGRPSALVGLNGAEALRQIPAEAIEKVEVITSPSARYDAEGTAGILNIILRKNQLTGFNGNVQVDLGFPERYGTSLNLNYRTKKWNFFTNTGFRYNAVPGNALNDTRFVLPDPIPSTADTIINSRSIEDRQFDRLGRSLFTSFGAEYFINDKSSIIANVIFNFGNDDDVSTNNIIRFNQIDERYIDALRTENEGEDEQRIQYTLDYINNFDGKGKKLNINLQYSTEVEDILNNINEVNLLGNTLIDLERVIEDQNEETVLLQADFVYPVGENIQYEAGYRGNYRDIFSRFFLAEAINQDSSGNRIPIDENAPLIPDANLNNSFGYKEFVNATYFQYGQQFNKFSLLAGLRHEYTLIEITQEATGVSENRNYGHFFPTINLGYEFKDGENITLGYNRRIRRPRGRFLNPFESRSSEANTFSGNINLNPVLTDALDLGYLKRWEKFTLSSSIYYNRSEDNWEFILEDTGRLTDDFDKVLRRFPINLSTEQRFGFEFTLNYKPYRWWNINSDFNVFHVSTDGGYTNPRGQFVDFTFQNTAFFIRLNQKITLPSKIDLQINSNYRGANENAQSRNQGIFSMNLAASKDILNDKGSISLNVSDVFNSRKRMSEFLVPGVSSGFSEFQWRERQILLSFVYRFNQNKKRDRGNRENYDDDGGGEF